MNSRLQKKAPLADALSAYAARNIVHFDVPGHKKRNSPELASFFGEGLLRLDANSTRELDMLGHPTGVIDEAERLMADAYGADSAFFLVNGSTSGVIYMVLAACEPMDKIIIPRNVHKSVISAVILAGAVPVFVAPMIDAEYGIANTVAPEELRRVISENPDAKAVFLINPTYFGAACDLRAIVRICRRHRLLVLVDEAHGAHFPFHRAFPCSAMEAGADLATVSLHKTAGSLTQSSALLLNEQNLTKQHVRSVVNLLQTTSASYLLMASLDIARRKLATAGQELFDRLLRELAAVKERINRISGLSVPDAAWRGPGVYGYDDTKIVISVKDLGLSGFEAYDILINDYGIQPELAETYVVLCVAGVGDDASTLAKLADALEDMSRRFFGKREPFEVAVTEFFEKPATVISPREAYYARKKTVPVEEAEGELCGESIMIYPPGIPLCIPGERITKKVLEHYRFYRDQNGLIVNDTGDPAFIRVLGE